MNPGDRKCLKYHAVWCFSNFNVRTNHLENLVKLWMRIKRPGVGLRVCSSTRPPGAAGAAERPPSGGALVLCSPRVVSGPAAAPGDSLGLQVLRPPSTPSDQNLWGVQPSICDECVPLVIRMLPQVGELLFKSLSPRLLPLPRISSHPCRRKLGFLPLLERIINYPLIPESLRPLTWSRCRGAALGRCSPIISQCLQSGASAQVIFHSGAHF